MVQIYVLEKWRNRCQIMDWRNLSNRTMLFDAVRQIAETLILSLYCVEALRGKDLRAVVAALAQSIYTGFSYCVESALETLALSGLSDEHPTDWVKSELLETHNIWNMTLPLQF